MFGPEIATGLEAGEKPETSWREEAEFDELCYQLTCEAVVECRLHNATSTT